MIIDYVVPMVFHDDHMWRENFVKVGSRYTESDPMEFVRYRSWGTEELLVKLVRKNMPWVRDIIILLAQESQLQEWMVAMMSEQTGRQGNKPRLRVVYHREFMPEWTLPTFNSRAMEMFLRDIPGISDFFLYGNDDMYPVSPLTVEDFFQNGKPRIHMTEKVFPEHPNNFQSACMRGLNFVAKEFGQRFTDKWYKNGHSIAPILKSTCEHLWQRGGNEIIASISPFRQCKNFNQYIYSWWHYLSGSYVDGRPSSKYVSTKSSVEDVGRAIEECCGIVCVNDNECVSDYEAYGRMVREKIEKRLQQYGQENRAA